MKKNLFMFLLLTLSVSVFTSCSNDDSRAESNSKEIDESLPSLKYNNRTLVVNEDGSFSNFKNSVFTNDYLISRENISISNQKNNTFIVTNDFSGEFIILKNIVESSNKIIFDVETSHGFILEELEFNSNNNKNPRIIWAVVAAVVTIVEAFEDSPLQQCTNAMKALNCAEGKNAYMNFSEGGWFSGPSCEVGCR